MAQKDSCTDFDCFTKKLNAFLDAKKEALKAKGEFVLVSTSQRASQSGVLPRAFDRKDKGWFEANANPVNALVVESERIREIGRVMKVSLTPPHRREPMNSYEKEQKATREKRKDLEMKKRVRRLMYRKLWDLRGTQKKTLTEKFFVLLTHAVKNLPSDNAKAIVRALDIPVVELKSNGYVHKDHAESILLWLQQFKNDELYHFGMLLAVSGDLMVNEYSQNGDQLAVITKLYGLEEKQCKKELLEGDTREAETKKAARGKGSEGQNKVG